MAADVVTQEENVGTIIGDVNSHRGQALRLNERDTSKVVDAHAPLSTLFGYVPGLWGLSRGRASAMMHFAYYASVAAQIVSA